MVVLFLEPYQAPRRGVETGQSILTKRAAGLGAARARFQVVRATTLPADLQNVLATPPRLGKRYSRLWRGVLIVAYETETIMACAFETIPARRWARHACRDAGEAYKLRGFLAGFRPRAVPVHRSVDRRAVQV